MKRARSKKRRNPITLDRHPNRKSLCRLLNRLATTKAYVKNLLFDGHAETTVICREAQSMGLITDFFEMEGRNYSDPSLTAKGKEALAANCKDVAKKSKKKKSKKKLRRKNPSKRKKQKKTKRHHKPKKQSRKTRRRK